MARSFRLLKKNLFIAVRFLKSVAKAFLPNSIWHGLKRALPNYRGDKNIEELYIQEWAASRNLAKVGNSKFPLKRGINLIGHIKASTGLGEAARSSLLALNQAHVPVELIDFEFGVPEKQQKEQIHLQPVKDEFAYQTNLIHINPLQMPYLWEKFGQEKLTGRYNIGFWYWELSGFPDFWKSRFDVVDEVWVATEFIRAAIQEKSPVPVVKIPPCIQVDCEPGLNRASFNLPKDVFLFLCAYDILSVHERRNPRAAIGAFKRAFDQNTRSVGLVIKLNNAQENPQAVEQLKRELADYPNCYFEDEVFTKPRFNALINQIDAFVSLHRSEGFGLIPAEAMYLGKPVIMTNWSGNVDFMTRDNSCGVDYQFVPVGSGCWPYPPEELWADPDVDHAAYFMKKLFEDTTYYQQISTNAAQTIHSMFSPALVGQMMRERLEKLKLL